MNAVVSLISQYVVRHCLVKPGDRLGVAVSGGADSVALLRALLELRSNLGIVLSVVHLHHGIRGTEADADENFVAELARTYDLPFHCDRADVPLLAKQHSLSLEAAARKFRYEYFERLLRKNLFDKICTAHTKDDQAETVLHRFLRGSGTRGLAGIHPVLKLECGEIIRPMLEVSRPDVVDYLKSIRQNWREDSSNADPKHTRNRIRHELLPLLERDYNPNLRQLLSDVAEASRDEEDYWSHLTADIVTAVIYQPDGRTFLRLTPTSPAIRRRLIREAAERVGLSLGLDHIQQLLLLADRKIAGNVELPGHRCARLTVYEGAPALVIETRALTPYAYEYALSIPSETPIPPLRTLVRVTFVQYTAEKELYNPASLLDASLVGTPLRLRNWRHGDRYRPLHRGSEEKLKRLFQEKQVPVDQRPFWPVVTSGDKVIWAKDFPVAAEFAAREGTSQAVLIEAVEIDRQTQK